MTAKPRLGVLALLLVLSGGAAFAQELDTRGMITGWHIVRPGENLIQITARYLGTSERWRDNWKLNPEIRDPDFIKPGTRLRILLDFEVAPPVARLKALSGQVEGRPVPIPWNEARVEDLLIERDGLRTYRNSSSELEFRDGTNLVLSEESLVFVRSSEPVVTGPRKRSVEIVEGQAEVQALRPDAPRTDIEIVVGSAVATATQGDQGRAQARARKTPEGTAQVMVYEGAGEVEAAGESVEVPRGMGTAVPENAPPSPPEKLLRAPRALAPAGGSELPYGDPVFDWEPVEEARAYTVEICADAACNELRLRAPEVSRPWRPEPLPKGPFYWRVTAVAPSGLDGYPSGPLPFTILFSGRDTKPPTGRVSLAGRSATHEGTTYYEAATRVEASMDDGESGLESFAVEIDGSEVAADGLAGPWSTGSHTARVMGADRAGNAGASEIVEFEVDAEAPAVELRLGGKDMLNEKLGAGAAPSDWCRRKKRWIRRQTEPTSGERPVWTLIAAGSDSTPIRGSYDAAEVLRDGHGTDTRVRVDGGNPGVLLLAAGRVAIGPHAVTVPDGGDLTFCRPAEPGGPGYAKNALLWVAADDRLSGEVTSLAIDTEMRPAETAGGSSETYLVITTEDVLGNRRQIDLRLGPLALAD